MTHPGTCRPLPTALESFIGIPYVSGGRGRAGCDCWGLVMLASAELFGTILPDYNGPEWNRHADASALGNAAGAFSMAFDEITAAQAVAGDGVLLRMRGYPIHAGLIVAPGTMLHTQASTGSVLASLAARQWKHRVTSYWRARRSPCTQH